MTQTCQNSTWEKLQNFCERTLTRPRWMRDITRKCKDQGDERGVDLKTLLGPGVGVVGRCLDFCQALLIGIHSEKPVTACLHFSLLPALLPKPCLVKPSSLQPGVTTSPTSNMKPVLLLHYLLLTCLAPQLVPGSPQEYILSRCWVWAQGREKASIKMRDERN